MNLECPRCGKSPWNWAGETEDYCRCGEDEDEFLPPPPNYVQQQPLKEKDGNQTDTRRIRKNS